MGVVSAECDALVADRTPRVRYCRKPATWHATWSDREMWVCEKHRNQVRWNRDHDHSYDRSILIWNALDGRHEYEPYRPKPAEARRDVGP